MLSPMIAAKAYAAVQQGGGATPSLGAGGAEGVDFSRMVQHAMDDAVGGQRKAEAMMQAHTAGKAELVDMVTAVSSAQASLETVMAVRDQVISAYQEIMRMPI
ncbi:flagellar hook-basal body complex protein FliE [soil metagenome]